MNTQPHIKRTLIHTALFIIAIGFSVMANAQGHVIFKGSVLRTTMNSPEVSMIVTDGIDTMDVHISRTGKYNFTIPANENVRVILTSKDHITKEIALDTRNAPSAKATRVEFFVELERQSLTNPMSYAGLAGRIYFTPQGKGARTLLEPTPQAKTLVMSPTISAKH